MNQNLIKFITNQSTFILEDYNSYYGTYEFISTDLKTDVRTLIANIHKEFNDLNIYVEDFADTIILTIED